MEEGNRPEDDIVTWLNEFKDDGVATVGCFVDLYDGLSLLQILNTVDQDIWPFTRSSRGSSSENESKTRRFTLIFKGIKEFFFKNMEINISDDVVDLSNIENFVSVTDCKIIFL